MDAIIFLKLHLEFQKDIKLNSIKKAFNQFNICIELVFNYRRFTIFQMEDHKQSIHPTNQIKFEDSSLIYNLLSILCINYEIS